MKSKKPKTAVALKYDSAKDHAPRIIGKGRGAVAAKLIEVARKRHIPVYEDRQLARLLEALDFNSEIPAELYQAVAEVLAFIYRLEQGS